MTPEKKLTAEQLNARREARIDRIALGSLPRVWDALLDMRGRPMPAVRSLNPDRPIDDFPRISQLRWGGGSWMNVGSGDRGDGAISLVEWLSCGAPRSVCTDFLEQTLAALTKAA